MSNTRSSKLGAQVFKLELDTFLRICEGVNTPRSLACFLLAKYGEWCQYLDLAMPDPDSDTFPDDYLATEAMRKNPRLPTGIDTTIPAKTKWFEAESLCAETNRILDAYFSGRLMFVGLSEDVITRTQRIIADVLGELTPSKLRFAERSFRFGPGSTSSVFGRDVVLSRKMTADFAVTPVLSPYLHACFPCQSGYGTQSITNISLLAYNKVTFVPKDSKTDRAIAIEPHGNIYVQLGIGSLLRRQMALAGLDLDIQQEDNRLRAGRCIKSGGCTIDLSSASDTIAARTVELLLPPDWYALLSLARCEYSLLDGNEIRLEKFSSMGNGFTFELETLIFWALARACGDDDAVAFGDDIITTSSVAPTLIQALNALGFKVNTRKTFLAGRFFESCGFDFHDGVNVRPLYFRGEYNDFTSCVIRTCNKVRLYAHRRNLGFGCDIRFLPSWLRCLHSDRQAGATGIPLGYGDSGLIRNFDEFTPSKARYGHCGYIGKVWTAAGRRSRRTVALGSYVSALRWGSADGSRLHETCRGDLQRAALKSCVVMTWDGPGAWCRF